MIGEGVVDIYEVGVFVGVCVEYVVGEEYCVGFGLDDLFVGLCVVVE